MTRSAFELVAEARAQIENVSAEQAFDEQAGGAVLLDVREPVEWERHIEGSVQIPRGLLEFAADPTSPRHNAALEPTARVIVYCRSGARAALAAATMKAMGFENVANMDGGLSAWNEAGLPTVEHHVGV